MRKLELLGTATHFDENILSTGTVVRVEIDEEPQPYGWESEDEKISEVGWCVGNTGRIILGAKRDSTFTGLRLESF